MDFFFLSGFHQTCHFFIPGNFVGAEFENADNCLEQPYQNSNSAWAAGYQEILDTFNVHCRSVPQSMQYFHSVRPSEHMLPRWTAQPIVNPLTVQSHISYIIYALYIWYSDMMGLQSFSVLHMLVDFYWVFLGANHLTFYLLVCMSLNDETLLPGKKLILGSVHKIQRDSVVVGQLRLHPNHWTRWNVGALGHTERSFQLLTASEEHQENVERLSKYPSESSWHWRMDFSKGSGTVCCRVFSVLFGVTVLTWSS